MKPQEYGHTFSVNIRDMTDEERTSLAQMQRAISASREIMTMNLLDGTLPVRKRPSMWCTIKNRIADSWAVLLGRAEIGNT